MIQLFNYILIANFFTGGFVFYNGTFDFYISYIFMAAFLSMFIIFYRKIIISRKFVYIFMFIFLVSCINCLQGNDSIFLLLKTSIALIFNVITYYLLIHLNDYKVDKLFRIYLKMAFIVALIGIFQEISFFAGFKPGYDFRYFIPRIGAPYSYFGILRIISIMPEPTHFGTVMMPAVFISILSLMGGKNSYIGKKASLLIIISALLTFSLVTYVGIVVAFILIMINYKKIRLMAMCAIIIAAVAFTTYRYLPMIKTRVDDTVAIVSGKKTLGEVNLSTFASYSNGFIAFKSFMKNPLFGSGLGSHPLSYDKYIAQAIDPANVWSFMNRTDASGLFFRLISETGMVGIFLFFYFIVKFYVSKTKDEYFWIISNSILCLFILNLLRQGNYFYSGSIFFILTYYFVRKNMRVPARHDS